MAGTDRRYALPPELGVAALVVAASIPLGRLFRTGSILSASIGAAAGSTAIAWAMRRIRIPTLIATVVSLAAFLWFASVAFFRDAMFGPFPSPESVSLILDATVDAIRRSQTDVAPVAGSSAFLCLASFAVWATAWLADDAAIKLRHPMLAIGVTIPLYVLPGTILEGDHRWADAGLYLGAALWVLFQDERHRLSRWGRVVGAGVPGWRPGLAARMGLVAIVLALFATPVLPGFGAPPGLRGITGRGGDRRAINPLVSIRPQLGERQPVDVFSVRTRVPTYWRLTALDLFDGLQWRSGPQRPQLPVSGRSIEPQNASSTSRVVQDFEIISLIGPWLPAAFEPVRVDGLRGAAADPTSRTLISPHDLRRGMKYRVTSRVPRLTYEQLALAPATNDPSLRPYLSLPPGLQTRRVAEIARDIVERADVEDAGPFRQAVALQNHLRTFTYNEDVALEHNIRDIQSFLLESKEGYCEQFATAMAVMARTLGLPARVSVGFAGGGPGRTVDEFVATSRNAHAWVEIWLLGYGWTPFEPTPRADSVVVPTYTSPSNLGPVPTPTAEPTDTAEPSPTATASPRSGIDPEAGGDTGATTLSGILIPVGLAAGALVVLLGVAFPVASVLRRIVRRRRAHTTQDRIALRYLDVLDWCASTGRGRRAGETPREHALRLAEASSDARTSLERLASMAVDAVYAPPNGLDPAGAARLAREARTEVAAGISRRTRILSRLGWGWWRSDPASRSPRARRERTFAGLAR